VNQPRYWHERNFGCRITETVYRGLRTVTLENELLRVSVLADKGSDIIEFLHKPSDTDFMWRSPLGVRNPANFVPTVARGDGAFLDFYEGGWQECFPSGGNTNEHAGTIFGLHGEVALMPWQYTIVEDHPDRVQVRFSVRTYRTPFLLEKTLTLERNRGVLDFEERVTNEGEEPVDFVWGHHPAFGPPFLDEQCVIDLPGGRVRSLKLTPTSRLEAGEGLPWPQAPGADGEIVDISQIPGPEVQSHDLAFITELPEGWYALTNPQRKVGFGMVWDIKVFPVLWFWQVYGGAWGSPWYGRTYNIAIEPWSTPDLTLTDAKEHNTHKTLGPGEILVTAFQAIAYAGVERVGRLHADGTVEGVAI
jgi:hypothetical protein